MKNKVSDYILNEVPFKPNYDAIKDKIDVNQYIEKREIIKKRTINIKLVTSVVLSILILCVGFFFLIDYKFNLGKLSDTIGNPNITTKYSRLNDVIIYDNDYELLKSCDYIFIGKVIEEVETKQYDGTGYKVPYTFYKIKEVEFLKGEKPEGDGLICFYGGMKSKNTRALFEFNDEILQEEKYYLFLMHKRVNDPNNFPNERVGENDYILARNDQKVLLDGYKENKSLNEQNDNIQYMINRFSNILNKELKNDCFEIPTFISNEEKIDYYEFVAVVQVYPIGIINLEGTGKGSDIPAVRYGFQPLHIYKWNSEYLNNRKIYVYGTNFWEGEKIFDNYVSVLEDGGCYLIFANKKATNDSNTRIGDEDFVIYDSHQIIKLDGYIPNYNISNQNDEIKEIIEAYFPLKKSNFK